MINQNDNILFLIDEFLKKTGMSETYFGKKAVGNTEVVRRLKMGRPILTTTEFRLRQFIREYRLKDRRKDAV